MPRPFFQILQGEIDLTAQLVGRNLALTISDNVGSRSDTIQFSIDNHSGQVRGFTTTGRAPPFETGGAVRVIGGYRGGQVRDFGLFTIDSVTLSGWPLKIDVGGQSLAAKSEIKARRKASYKASDFPTYGDLFAEVARRNGLTLAAAPEISARVLAYEAQSEENDLEFLTRLGRKLGATVTVKSAHLVIGERGKGTSVSGQRLPIIHVLPGVNALSFTVNLNDRAKYRGVKATWFDREAAETRELEEPSFGEGPIHLLREPFASESEAREAAAAKAADLRRAIGTATFEINGFPFAMAEAPVEVRGCGAQVDGLWRATNVTHSWSGDGPYTTSVTCESPDVGPTTTQPALPALDRVPVPTPRPA